MGTCKKDDLQDHELFDCHRNGDCRSPSACNSASTLLNSRISCSLAIVPTVMREALACPRPIYGALQGHRGTASYDIKLPSITLHILESTACGAYFHYHMHSKVTFLLSCVCHLNKTICFTTESATRWGLGLPSPRVVGQHKGHAGAVRRGR